jgi:hypothetical protein
VLSARFKAIAITNPEYLKSIGSSGSLWDLSRIVLKNFLTHLHPDYLFFKGTPNNLTLSTGHQGIMSWLDSTAVLAALGWLIWKIKNKVTIASKGTVAWLGFLGVNIFIGIIPATLISIDNPHTLRTIGAWPFAMLATGFILHRMTQEHLWRAWAAVSIGALFTVIFLRQYFVDYAKYSGGFFSVWTMEEAKNAKTNDAWMNFLYRYHYHMFLSRYYLMRYHGDSCVQARTTWENLYPMFKKLHEQNDPKKP